ncbi:MAG: hypothetical protein ACTHMY_12035 [Solirubrobacteraceae bacterium]
MSMPLPLELTKPVLLAGDLDSLVQSQLCGGTQSQAQSNSLNLLTGITVDGVDAVVDDNDVL